MTINNQKTAPQTANAANLAQHSPKNEERLKTRAQNEEDDGNLETAYQLRLQIFDLYNTQKNLFNAALLSLKTRRIKEAIELFNRFLIDAKDDSEAWMCLSAAYEEDRNFMEALKCIHHALLLDKNNKYILNNASILIKKLPQSPEVIEFLTEKNNAEVFDNIIKDALKTENEKENERAPDIIKKISKCNDLIDSFILTFDSNLNPSLSLDDVYKIHQTTAKKIEQKYQKLTHDFKNHNDQKIRIGYVSHDFNLHPVGRFIASLLPHHNTKKFKIYLFMTGESNDHCTERLKLHCEKFISISKLNSTEKREKILSEHIDILIDLVGYTAIDEGELAIFAMRSAPVQVSWLAYLNTTALQEMDYHITDKYSTPEHYERFYSEKLLFLPFSKWGYGIEDHRMLPPEKPPKNRERFIFGSTNSEQKINMHLIDLWSKILEIKADSEMLIIGVNSYIKKLLIIERLKKNKIDIKRVTIKPRTKTIQDYFAIYHEIDLVLDTWPYSGGTTTFDALYSNVPVLTLANGAIMANSSSSILTNAGLDLFVTKSPEEYVNTAIKISTDADILKTCKEKLRSSFSSSPLMDLPRFARDIESIYEQISVKAHNNNTPEHAKNIKKIKKKSLLSRFIAKIF